jgi:hypothetical protein
MRPWQRQSICSLFSKGEKAMANNSCAQQSPRQPEFPEAAWWLRGCFCNVLPVVSPLLIVLAVLFWRNGSWAFTRTPQGIILAGVLLLGLALVLSVLYSFRLKPKKKEQ